MKKAADSLDRSTCNVTEVIYAMRRATNYGSDRHKMTSCYAQGIFTLYFIINIICITK